MQLREIVGEAGAEATHVAEREIATVAGTHIGDSGFGRSQTGKSSSRLLRPARAWRAPVPGTTLG
jgi:hypothetical protein